MRTECIPASQVGAIPYAIKVLKAGGLVAFPTDTVYGLGSMAFNSQAIDNIYLAKERPAEKAIPILIGTPDDLEKVAAEIPSLASKLAARFWPGPLTLVLPKHPDLPENVSNSPTVGVRIPDHPVARQLLLASGPMAVTSANLSGKENPITAGQVMEQLNGRIQLVLDGGETPGGIPSTVINCTGSEPIILREGPITGKDIQFLYI